MNKHRSLDIRHLELQIKTCENYARTARDLNLRAEFAQHAIMWRNMLIQRLQYEKSMKATALWFWS
jgi:hypothetical protein